MANKRFRQDSLVFPREQLPYQHAQSCQRAGRVRVAAGKLRLQYDSLRRARIASPTSTFRRLGL